MKFLGLLMLLVLAFLVRGLFTRANRYRREQDAGENSVQSSPDERFIRKRVSN